MNTAHSHRFPVLYPGPALELLEFLRESTLPSARGSKQERPSRFSPSYIATQDYFDVDYLSEIRDEVVSLAMDFPESISEVEKSRNAFDLAFARLIYEKLKHLPRAALLNKDFWRFLAIYLLFEVGAWRYPDQGKKTWGQNFGATGNFSRCFPYKAFLRGKLIARLGDLGLPWKDVEDVDFYDSHLFGRRNALIPGVASALNTIRQDVTSSRALDPYARTIRQFRGTHLTELLTVEEVKEAILRYSDENGT